MADPFTALGAAASAFQIGKVALELGTYLWKLGKAVTKIKQTVNNLAAEAEALSQVCVLIDGEISGPGGIGMSSQYDQDGLLWKSACLQLTATKDTIGDLRRVVGADGQEIEGLIEKIRKQIDLDQKKDELETIRQRLHTHTQTLQTTLQMINMLVLDSIYSGGVLTRDQQDYQPHTKDCFRGPGYQT